MPPGWKCVQKQYLTGQHRGRTYVRFQNDIHKNVISLKVALELHAQDTDQDPAKLLGEYRRAQREKKEETLWALAMEEPEIVKSRKKDEDIECFRSVYGKLDSPTVVRLPGWRKDLKTFENCGQVVASYYAPDGKVFKFLKDIEAYFGACMMSGEDIPDIFLARSLALRDEKGKIMGAARRSDKAEEPETPAKKRRVLKKEAEVGKDRDQDMSIVQARGGVPCDSEASAAKDEALRETAADIHKLLVGRGFAEEGDLVTIVLTKR